MLIRLAHACYNVKNLEKSIRFYKKIGLKYAFDFKDKKGKRFGVYLKAGKGTFIEMFQMAKKLIKKGKMKSHFHISFEINDAKAAEKSLKKQGIKILNKFHGSEDSDLIFIEDPDGNSVELQCYGRKSPQRRHLK